MLIPHPKQVEFIKSPKRFKVGRAGRKGGKTAMEVEIISYKAVVSVEKLKLTKSTFSTGRKIIYIAPTQKQAREIVWASFKNRLDGVGSFNEQRLEIQVPNADGLITTIMIGGWENRENYRGLTDVIHITFDELDTLKDFFINWQEIFRPMFLDTGGTADFIGTPKKENPNLKRLEKQAEIDDNYACFHFTSKDNPHLSRGELEAIEKEYEGDRTSYQQEILAEHIENTGALFRYSSLIDVFTNTITKKNERYLIVDVADDGTDKTIFSFWEGLEEYHREEFARLNTESIIAKIREYTVSQKIPMSHVAVDAIGVGAGVASSSLLDGIIGYKSSYSAIKTDDNIVLLPNVGTTANLRLTSDYANLRSQCIFTLAELVNNHNIASTVTGEFKEKVIEELSKYQDASTGDGKRRATGKDEVKEMIGRSPDHSDTWIMRMYFEVRNKVAPDMTERQVQIRNKMQDQFAQRKNSMKQNSAK